ncbi:Aste57867_1215 [Aphanomyces stellatus]|uniref:Palmitoyltransferase n=1 Tax=Aphanomyces stellatus TaxID=120398 RepID=A0A485K528_9STRA|nr:hypothetical protein As57867_001214 [Aphanomyces stellatus]VFT78435.1 Aste57867_1215 [Aphanomyces stellatus]
MVKVFVAVTCALMALKILCMLAWVHLPPFHVFVYVVLTILMLVSYAGTVFILPSFPVGMLADDSSDAVDGKEDDDPLEEARYCEKCDRAKPEGYHHCSVCGQCISHMDHHCPWTGNCVGLRTKKLFILFLLYTSLACLWFAYCVVFVTPHGARGAVLFTTVVLATLIGFLLLGYFGFHVYLLAHGQTTLDFLARRAGTSHAGFHHNLQVYFGPNWWAYPVPLVPACLWAPSSSH